MIRGGAKKKLLSAEGSVAQSAIEPHGYGYLKKFVSLQKL
jgi:hypothetical protein